MDISEDQIDILTELINLGVGQAAGMLNQMVGEHITMKVPSIQITTAQELPKTFNFVKSEKYAFVRLDFKGSMSGTASLVFPSDSASKLVSLVIGEEVNSILINSLSSGTLEEIGNILLNAVMGVLANMLKTHLSYSIPSYYEDIVNHYIEKIVDPKNKIIIIAKTIFDIAKYSITGEIILIFEVEGFQHLLNVINKLYTSI